MRVAVAGASGYAGGELLRLLAGHPQLEIAVLTADSSAGKSVAQAHRHLAGQPGLADLVFEPHHALKQAECDLVFMAMPSGQSAPLAADLPDETKIVDLGPDFRLADANAWNRHYDGAYAGRWVTGLPELPGAREQVKAARRVAAPGCYSTAAILALAPLVAAGLVEPADIVVVAASGTSGAGKSLRADLLGSEVMGSVSAYQVAGAHRHTPEIEQALAEVLSGGGPGGGGPGGAGPGGAGPGGADPRGGGPGGVPRNPAETAPRVSVSFTPVLVPMPRGILATATARLKRATTDTATLSEALRTAYAAEPFACVLPPGAWPATGAVAGSNGVHLQVAADHRAGRAVVVAAIDNLGKGAAGQAIQNANLMLGLPEAAGLTSIGVAP
ncbi:MAG TPA: NAGSA dehydrogenase family protein [Streptosporangiaceae bacterium]|nr:NAGSA dehydrogenase family protein [Streptosporangiaceae bacterium]